MADSRNPLADEDENRDPKSGEPEVWKGRYDDEGEVAKGGSAGAPLYTEEDLKNPFDDTDEDEDGQADV